MSHLSFSDCVMRCSHYLTTSVSFWLFCILRGNEMEERLKITGSLGMVKGIIQKAQSVPAVP